MGNANSPQPPPLPLIGRARELQQLSRCLTQVREGRGASVVVSGEAGVGKTILVNQLRGMALCVSGNCYEYSAAPPYGPWLEVLDDLRRHGLTPAGSQITSTAGWSAAHDQHEILMKVLHELSEAAARQPLVVILEDMHWADDASVELLRAVCRQVSRHAMLIVVTYRDDDLTRSSPLYRLLPYLLRDGGAQRMHLHRLGKESTHEIVSRRYDLNESDRLRLSAYLQTRAQGNPFFTMELLYALEDQQTLRQVNGKWQIEKLDGTGSVHPLPDLVRQVIDGRLERLSDLTRRLLQVAAVIGQEVPIQLWRSLSDVDEHAFSVGVERAMAAHFVQETAGGRTVSFRHALVREVIYLSVVLPERQRLHCLAAEVLLRAPDPDADRVAYHFARAMDRRAIEWLSAAAARALALWAPYAAIDHCNNALDLAASDNTAVPLDVYSTRGKAYATIGAFQDALRDLTTYLERSRECHDLFNEWQALQDLGQLWSARDYSRSRDLFEEALSRARDLGDDQRIAHSLNRVGNWYLNDDRPAQAIRFHEEALAIFGREGDLLPVAQTRDLLGMNLLILGDLIAAGRVLREAIDAFELLDERVGLCSALGTLITAAGSNGFDHELPARIPPTDLEQMMDQALALARETSWRSGESFTLSVVGNHHLIRGKYGQALQAFTEAAAIAAEIEHREWTSFAVSGIADTYLALLQTEQAREFAERALEAALAGGSGIHEKGARASLSRVHLASGDFQSALTVLGARHKPHEAPESSTQRFCRVFQAQALLSSGDPHAALETIDQLIRTTLPPDHRQRAPIVGRTRAEVLLALERHAEAEVELLAARDFARELGYHPELWRILLLLGNLYLSRHRPGDARRSFTESRAVLEHMARSLPDTVLAGHFLETARAPFPDKRGLSPLRAARQDSGGLTPRQREVAILVARGRTNAAISNELSISERTVEGHVSAIMTTLDFTSRSQIAAWAVDQQLVTL